MTARVADASLPTPAEIAGLEPLRRIRSRWPLVLGGVLTVAMVVGLARELFGSGLAGLTRSVPTDPRFYLAFGLLYMVPQSYDFLIFRRLWGLPLAGLAALTKKRIANDVVMGYSGETYFYAWARARAKIVAAPFGAVKDVSIMSAMAGNTITLVMIAVVLPLGIELLTPAQAKMVWGSAAVVIATTLPFLIFSRRVFSLSRPMLRWIFSIQCLRVATGSTLLALAWHFALPEISVAMWLFLAAARLLVSRLPLVPNKDLLFANFAILLIGRDRALSELMAFIAASNLLVHIALLAAFGAWGLFTRAKT